jgi:alkanesulfonate monooxygenase SsuD/methylene tetrahydromethanopterin reductase-like flavin-dependent oxidoreductase (luciferase family)
VLDQWPAFSVLTFGVAPYEALEREWKWAEEIGFGGVWVPDTFTLQGLADFETWALLAAVARTTRRARIGSLVTVIMARPPALLAASVLTVDHISGGRVRLGIGVGDTPEDADALGLPRWPARERVDRLGEQLEILDRVLRGETVATTGIYYALSGVKPVTPVQRPRPPIVVAAEGPRAMRLAARYADGWVTLAGQPPKEWAGGGGGPISRDQAVAATRDRAERLASAAHDAGRDPRAIRKIALAYRQPVDPLTSLDAFDDFVGAFAAAGIDEFVFYWPPVADLRARHPVAEARRREVERIASARFSSLT